MPLLVAWLIINLIVLLFMLNDMPQTEGWWDVLVYPKLHEYLDKEEVNSFAVLFVDFWFTLLLLPALLVYFIILVFIVIISLIILVILEIIGKK